MSGPMLALGTQPCLGRPLSRSEEDTRRAHNPKRVVPTAVWFPLLCVVTGKAGRSREVAVPAAGGLWATSQHWHQSARLLRSVGQVLGVFQRSVAPFLLGRSGTVIAPHGALQP